MADEEEDVGTSGEENPGCSNVPGCIFGMVLLILVLTFLLYPFYQDRLEMEKQKKSAPVEKKEGAP